MAGLVRLLEIHAAAGMDPRAHVHDPAPPGRLGSLQAHGQQEGGEEVDLPDRL
jgi:hypothetical protein